MKYLKYFEQASAYEAYKNGSDYVLPNISYVEEAKDVSYKPKAPEPTSVGDIAYWDGKKVKTVSQDNWDASLGTPVGVVVVPTGFAPDGKARMLSLNWASSSSTSSEQANQMKWSNIRVDTSLTNYTGVPTTDNTGSATTGFDNWAYLPSDKFSGTVSYVDPLSQYDGTSRIMIPSPYLGDKPNPAYYATIPDYNNVLSDFDGKGNTDVLVALGSDYVAANAARNYKAAGAKRIKWYLPAAGELGYVVVRFNKIQAALTKVNACQLQSDFFWSSSEYSSKYPCSVTMNSGGVGDDDSKIQSNYVRPFAIIE